MKHSKYLAFCAFAALWLATGYPTAANAQPSPSESAAATTLDTFPPDQIEQLVAPIALYPDALTAQILMASTYPLDVVEAARWVADHKDLQGEELEKAAAKQGWDPSVATLVFFPEVLEFMNKNLDWTQDLGDAVLAQQDDVTGALQKLRHEAQAAGNLQSTEQQTVETKGDDILIQPAQPEVVYVPSYKPSEVYGQNTPPATSYYPAAYTQPVTSSYVAPATATLSDTSSSTSDSLVNFGVGALAGGLLTAAIMWNDDDRDRIYYGGPGYYGAPSYWSRPNYWDRGWREPREINIDRNIQRGDVNINRGIVGNEIKAGKWEHNPVNRGRVRYRNKDVQKKFANHDRKHYVNRDIARGRDPARKAVKLPGKGGAPKLNAAQRKRLDRTSGSSGPKLNGRRPAAKGPGKAPKLAQAKRPTNKVATRQPRAKKPIAKPQGKRVAKRPANVSPKTRQAVAKRRPAAAKRTARRSGGSSSAFKVSRGSKTRAASKRGARSRSGVKHRGARRGGGRRR